jgi:hypothetical protein
MNALHAPDTEHYTATLWQSLFNKQMRSGYKSSTDLFGAYARMDKVEGFALRQSLILSRCEPDYLLSIAASVYYKNADQHPGLAGLCREQHYPERVFNDALHVMQKASPIDLIPDLHIEGEIFGMPGYELIKIPKTDPLILIAGAMTHCCGHIGGGPKKLPLVRAMVTHPDVGCYVICEKGQRKPVVKMTVWLSDLEDSGSALVVNAWHDSNRLARSLRPRILAVIADEVRRHNPLIHSLFIGKNGDDLGYPEIVNDGGVSPRDRNIRNKDTDRLYKVGTSALGAPIVGG